MPHYRHLRLCPPVLPVCWEELEAALLKRLRQWDARHHGEGDDFLWSTTDLRGRVLETARWFVDRWWDEVIDLGLVQVSCTCSFTRFPVGSVLWAGLVDAAPKDRRLDASYLRAPGEPRRSSLYSRRVGRPVLRVLDD